MRIKPTLLVILSFFAISCITEEERANLQNDPDARGLTEARAQGPIPEFPTTCLGPGGTGRQAIFLHGMQTRETATGLMAGYLSALKQVAEATGYRIAVPESRLLCNRSRTVRCWPGDNASEVAATYDAVVRSASRCFDTQQGFGLIGFSNGGYHTNRVAMLCMPQRPKWIISFGAAGDARFAKDFDMRACSPLAIAIGSQDTTREKARMLAAQLKWRRLPVSFETFRGGHEVPYELLAQYLERRR